MASVHRHHRGAARSTSPHHRRGRWCRAPCGPAAHHLGVTVIAVANGVKHAWLRELGADVTVDYHDTRAVAELEAQPVDLALGLAAGSRDFAVRAVQPGGTLIVLGGGADTVAGAAESANVHLAITHVHTERTWLEDVTRLAGEGVLVPTVTQVFDLAAASDAHRALEVATVKARPSCAPERQISQTYPWSPAAHFEKPIQPHTGCRTFLELHERKAPPTG